MKMSKLEKRRLIVKDMLEQVELGVFNVYSGAYITWKDTGEGKPTASWELHEQIQKYVPEIKSKCEVCALGGMFLTYIEHFNRVTFGHVEMHGFSFCPSYREELINVLSEVFDVEQLDMIETAFEYNMGFTSIEVHFRVTQELYDRCVEFGRKYPNDRERLIAILTNMLSNEACEFRP